MSTSAVPIKESSASPSSFNHLSKSPGNLSRWSSALPRTGLPSGRVTDDLNSALRLSPVFLGTSARPWLTLATTWTCRANPTKIHNLECGTSRQKSNLDSDRPTTQQWGKSKGKIQDRHGGKVQGLKSNTAPHPETQMWSQNPRIGPGNSAAQAFQKGSAWEHNLHNASFRQSAAKESGVDLSKIQKLLKSRWSRPSRIEWIRDLIISGWMIRRVGTSWGKLISRVEPPCDYGCSCLPDAWAKSIGWGTSLCQSRKSNIWVQSNNLTDTWGLECQPLQQRQPVSPGCWCAVVSSTSKLKLQTWQAQAAFLCRRHKSLHGMWSGSLDLNDMKVCMQDEIFTPCLLCSSHLLVGTRNKQTLQAAPSYSSPHFGSRSSFGVGLRPFPPNFPDPADGDGFAFATVGLHVDAAAPSRQSTGSSPVTHTISSSGSPSSARSVASDIESSPSSSV